MPWGAIAGAVAGPLISNMFGSGSGGGGAAGSQAMYNPTGEAAVDQSWQNMYNQQGQIANQTNQATQPYYGQSLAQGENINYQPYLQGAQQAGDMYGQVGQAAQGQMAGYGQQAQTALGQQQQMYGAGNQIMQTAFDPQNALYQQTQQQLTDQTRAGQAARGLGNSAEGAMEESNAMSNFDINWQNNQLQRQAQGISSGVAANQAGVQQGNLYGQNQTAALTAGGAAAGYYGQQGSVPMQAQQYAAQQPGAVAQQYQQYMAGQQGMNTTAMNGAQSYMGLGQTASSGNYNANAANNASLASLGTQLGTGLYNAWNSQPSQAGTPISQSPYASYTSANTQGYTTGDNYYP